MIIIQLLYMSSENINNIDKTYKYIDNLYDNLSFVDSNISSILLFIFYTTFVILLYTYFSINRNSANIKQNWNTQRCKPSVMPFAGLINKPPTMGIFEYTAVNFMECINMISSSAMSNSGQIFNINGMLNGVSGNMSNLFNYLNDFSFNLDGIQKMLEDRFNALNNQFSNTMVQIQIMILAVKDILSKSQAVFLTGIYTSLANSFILKKMVQQMILFITNIFTSLFILIGMLFMIPMAQGFGLTISAVVIPLSIAFLVTNRELATMFVVKPGNMKSPPSLPKCFSKDTLLKMNDGTIKTIEEIQVGDILYPQSEVTATFKLDAKDVLMCKLGNVVVSDHHRVFYKTKWIYVIEHPNAQIVHYKEPFIYCLNTTNKSIQIDNQLFLDWDELYDDILEDFMFYKMPYYNTTINHKSNIHKYLDGGFVENTKIFMSDYTTKLIKDIQVGDILCNGEIVYGLVEIKGSDLVITNEYNLGKYCKFIGGPNLIMLQSKNKKCSTLDSKFINTHTNNIISTSNHDKLYHLLTDQKSFFVDTIKFCDYNSLIDSILYP